MHECNELSQDASVLPKTAQNPAFPNLTLLVLRIPEIRLSLTKSSRCSKAILKLNWMRRVNTEIEPKSTVDKPGGGQAGEFHEIQR